MSDISDFRAIKNNFQKDPVQMAWRDQLARNAVKRDIDTGCPNLAQNAHNVALADLAFADLQADWSDAETARVLYDDALEMMKTSKKAGASTGDLDAIARTVGQRIPPAPPKF